MQFRIFLGILENGYLQNDSNEALDIKGNPYINLANLYVKSL